MYTPSAPKFELNAGTARWMLHYLNNPPPPPDPMEIDDLAPPPLSCTDPAVYKEWLDKMCPPHPAPLVRQNALSREQWQIILGEL